MVRDTKALIAAVRDGPEGCTIPIAPGTYELDAPVELRTGMTLKGAGMGKTVIAPTARWQPSTDGLPKGELRPEEADPDAYLIRLPNKAAGITISDLTLRGPQVHGAIFGVWNRNVDLHHLKIENVLYSGIRVYTMQNARIHDCEFVGAGGKWKRGGVDGELTVDGWKTRPTQ